MAIGEPGQNFCYELLFRSSEKRAIWLSRFRRVELSFLDAASVDLVHLQEVIGKGAHHHTSCRAGQISKVERLRDPCVILVFQCGKFTRGKAEHRRGNESARTVGFGCRQIPKLRVYLV